MYSIRKYIPSDKERLRFICKKTAGEENQNKPDVLESLSIIFNDYFTENEPDNIFVAVNKENIPVGYVICSTDISLFKKKMLTEYDKRVRKVCPSSLFIHYASVISVLIAKKQYRTHLHIDLLPEAQRQGLGTKLINSLCEHLRSKGIKNVSVMTINKKSMGYKFYTKYGFRQFLKISPDRISMTYDIR